jgi:hypothetical protein
MRRSFMVEQDPLAVEQHMQPAIAEPTIICSSLNR